MHEEKHLEKIMKCMYQKKPENVVCTGFSYFGPKLYNMIPKDIKEEKTTDDFKTQLKGLIWKNIH